jgi:hypothetical protein
MPALPVLDSHSLSRGLAAAGHVIVRRNVDHRALEALAVSMFASLHLPGLTDAIVLLTL